tara:strand:+ start:338 stop:1237 length:900 start_codon:yes stop_codon:yes gene_type:complete
MIKIVIIGYGAAGRRHAKILEKNFKNIEIYIFTKQNIKKFKSFNNLSYIKVINPDYIIIASETYNHLNQLKYLEKNFTNKKILVEKPLFHKFYNLNFKKNNIFINYNLRFHPYIKKLKEILLKEKIYDIKFITNSYLPNWRKNISYKKNYTVLKSKGGGVILDLSHELDIINNFFKKISIVNVLFGKKSDLTKDTEDFLRLTARSNKTNISLDINYYSRNEIRVILIDSKNFSIYVDLKRNIFRLNRDKKSFELRKKYTQDFTFLKTHEAIINGKDKSSLSKLNDGLKVLKMIQNIKKI